MNIEQVTDEILVAYVDDELDKKTRANLEYFLSESEEMRTKIAAFRATSKLLRSEIFDATAPTPDAIATKIRSIDYKIKTAQQKPDKSFKVGNVAEFFSWKMAYSATAAFVLGIFFNPTIFLATDSIDPSVSTQFTPGKEVVQLQHQNGSDKKTPFQEFKNEVQLSMPQTSMRGSSTSVAYLEVLVKQKDNLFDNKSAIQAEEPFNFVIKSPIAGSLELAESEQGKVEVIYESIEDIDADTYITLPLMEVDSQTELTVILSLKNSNTTIIHTIIFPIFQ